MSEENLFQWYLDYAQTDEYKQDAQKHHEFERREEVKEYDRISARQYRLKFPRAAVLREQARRQKTTLYRQQNGVCYWCGKPMEISNCEVDHILPISQGGTNEDNLCVVHRECNDRGRPRG